MKTFVYKGKKIVKNMIFCVTLVMKASKRSFAVLSLLTVLISILPLLTFYISKLLIDALSVAFSGSSVNMCGFLLMLGVYVAVSGSGSVIIFWLNKRKIIHIQNLLKYLNVGVMKKAVLLDVSSFDIPEQYESFRRGKNNVLDFQRIVFDTMQVICDLFSFGFCFAIIWKYNYVYIIVIVLLCIPKAIWTRKKKENEYRFQKDIAIEEKRKNYFFNLLFQKQSAIEIKYNSMEGIFFNKYKDLLSELNNKQNDFALKSNIISILIELVDKVQFAVFNVDIVLKIVYGKATIGDFGYYIGVFETFLNSVNSLGDNFATYAAFEEKINEYKSFFGNDEAVSKGERKLDEITTIEFKNVSFTYPGNENAALKEVSFKINEGEKVYLIGLNGSGKSTIIKLLCRFYEVDSGMILINGNPINEYDVQSLRECITAVFQDYVTYSLSLRESIIFGNVCDEETDKLILEALKRAEFDMNSIEGFCLDSYINKEFHEDGYELSGGQKQKIAVGRALYRKASLQLMDESTASLDPEAEAAVLNSLLAKDDKRINIVVSHCLAYAKNADNVIFLTGGKVVGIGSHSQMMRNVPEYKDFYEIQRKKYI